MKEEDDDYSFDKMCRVCLTEDGEMVSLLTASAKVEVENSYKLVTLHDVLSYVIQSQVLFTNGPYLICSNCVTDVCVAYKFKRRYEEASTMLRDYGLTPCGIKDFAQQKNISFSKLKIPYSGTRTNMCINLVDANFDVDSIKSEESYDEITVDEVELDEVIKKEDLARENHVSDAIIKEENSVRDSDELKELRRDRVQNTKAMPTGNNALTDSDYILCPVCGFKKSRTSFRRHMLRHAGEKKHVCPYCQRRFNDKGNMNVHVRIHTGVYPFSCDVCSKRFIQSSTLKIHKRLHDNVRPYKCHVCSFHARTSSQLGVHIKRHFGIKNYHCAQCEYSAYSKSEIRVHVVKHMKERCHICKICGKGFARYNTLKTHEKLHAGKKPHTCELCGRGFTQGHSLRSHLKNVHKKID